MSLPRSVKPSESPPPHVGTIFDDPEFLNALAAQIVGDAETLGRLTSVLGGGKDFQPSMGADADANYRWIVVQRALTFYGKHREPIGPRLRSELISYAKDQGIEGRKLVALLDCGKRISSRKLIGIEDIISKVTRFKKEKAKAAAVEELIELQTLGQLSDEKWLEVTQRAIHTGCETVVSPMTATELLQTDFPEPVYHLNNIMPRGLTLLASRPKVGKSWLALQLAIATASKRPFLGRKVKSPGKVLFVALEDGPQRIQERLHILLPEIREGEADKTALGKIRFLHEILPLEQGGLTHLGALLEKEEATGEPFKLLVLDHWLAASGERKGNDLVRGEYKEVAALRRLATDHKVAVVLIHHLRKMMAIDAGEMIIGTTGVTAAVDSYWVITTGSDDRTKRLEIKGRDIRERSLAIQFKVLGSERGWRVIEEGVEVQAGPVGKEILRHLKSAGPRTQKQIAEALNRPVNAIYENIHRLHKHGRVLKMEGSKYAYPKT